jgi:hypothetical protein
MFYIILYTFALLMSIILSYHMSLCLELHVVMFATSFRVLGTCVMWNRPIRFDIWLSCASDVLAIHFNINQILT